MGSVGLWNWLQTLLPTFATSRRLSTDTSSVVVIIGPLINCSDIRLLRIGQKGNFVRRANEYMLCDSAV